MDKVLIILLGLLVMAGLGVLIALPLMLLWNWLMPVIFGLQEITFLQALGMFILTNLLFKGNNNEE